MDPFHTIRNARRCCLAGLLAVAFAGTAAADGLVFTGALSAGDTTQTDRHNRNSIRSVCGTAKGFGGVVTTGLQHRFETHSFVNESSFSRCFQISTFSQSSNGSTSNAFTTAYASSYDPNDKAANFVGDPGDSSSGFPWQIDVPAGGTIVLVIEQVVPSFEIDSYTIFVSSSRNEGVTWTDEKSGVVQQWDFTDSGTLEFDSYSVTAPFGSFAGWSLVDCCDLNRDGEQDFVFRSAKLGLIGVSIGTTTQVGASQRFQILGSTRKSQEFICCADVDADGDGDLVQHDKKSNEVAIWILGDGVFEEELLLSDAVFDGFTLAACSDLDRDGDADFIWAQPKTGAVLITRTNHLDPATPTLHDGFISSVTPGPNSIVLGESGWLLTCTEEGRLIWFHTKTRGVVAWTFLVFSGANAEFSEALLTDGSGGPLLLPKGIEIAGCGDFDASGLNDLFVRNQKSRQVGWFLDYDVLSNVLVLRGPDEASTSVGLQPLSEAEADRVGNKKFAIRCPRRNTRTK